MMTKCFSQKETKDVKADSKLKSVQRARKLSIHPNDDGDPNFADPSFDVE